MVSRDGQAFLKDDQLLSHRPNKLECFFAFMITGHLTKMTLQPVTQIPFPPFYIWIQVSDYLMVAPFDLIQKQFD